MGTGRVKATHGPGDPLAWWDVSEESPGGRVPWESSMTVHPSGAQRPHFMEGIWGFPSILGSTTGLWRASPNPLGLPQFDTFWNSLYYVPGSPAEQCMLG